MVCQFETSLPKNNRQRQPMPPEIEKKRREVQHQSMLLRRLPHSGQLAANQPGNITARLVALELYRNNCRKYFHNQKQFCGVSVRLGLAGPACERRVSVHWWLLLSNNNDLLRACLWLLFATSKALVFSR